jgi:hypothetical protein
MERIYGVSRRPAPDPWPAHLRYSANRQNECTSSDPHAGQITSALLPQCSSRNRWNTSSSPRAKTSDADNQRASAVTRSDVDPCANERCVQIALPYDTAETARPLSMSCPTEAPHSASPLGMDDYQSPQSEDAICSKIMRTHGQTATLTRKWTDRETAIAPQSRRGDALTCARGRRRRRCRFGRAHSFGGPTASKANPQPDEPDQDQVRGHDVVKQPRPNQNRDP